MYKKLRKILSSFLVICLVLGSVSISASAADSSDISITTQPSDATVYAGDTVTLTVKATGSGTLKYQWYKNTKDKTTGGTQISGGTSSSYSPSTTSAGTTYYYCLVYTIGSSVSSTTSSTAAVVVKAAPKITEQPSDTTAYVGGTIEFSIKATGSGTLSYQWYSNTKKSTTGATSISGATDKSYKAPTTTTGTTYYYCVVTSTDSSMTGDKTATATSSLVKAVVREITYTPAITTQPTAVSVYTDSTAKFTIAAVGNGTLSYQWYSNTTKSTTGASAISGATGTAYSASTEAEGTAYYYCVITNTVASDSGTKTYTTTSNIVACTVKSGLVITQEPFDTTAYIGDTVTLYVAATGSGTLSYQWYSNTKSSTSGSSKISDATAASYAAPTTATGTTYYYCIVKNTDSTMTDSTSSEASCLAKVVVLAKSASAPTITTQPSSVSVYAGSTATLTVAAAGTGTLSYQWYSNTENSTSTGAKISGAMASKYSAPTSSEGTTYYYCVITNTAETASGTEAMTAVSDTASVSVKALPAIKTQPSGTTVYAGETATLTVEATGSGTLTYQWYSNTKNSSSGGSKISGATSSTYTVQIKAAGTTYCYCVATNTDSSITGTSTASVTSSTAAVTVKSKDVSAPTITKKPVSLTVVPGDEATLSIEANGSGTLSYQWYSNSKNSTTGAAAISGATGKSYTVIPTAAGTTYYYCVVTNTDSTMPGNQAASATSSIASVTVKTVSPTIKQQPVSSNVFQGGSLSLTIKAAGSGTLSYQWYSNAESSSTSGTAISGATSSTYQVPTTSAGTTYYYCIVTNTVKKSSESATGTVTSNIAAVTVNAAPTITKQPESITINSGEAFTLSVEATGDGTLTYQWYSNIKDKNSGGKAIKGATSSAYSYTTAASATTTTTYYYCVVTGKDGSVSKGKAATMTSSTAAVTANAVNASAPTITTKPTNQTVILGSSVTLAIEATGSGTLSYQWYSNSKSSTKGATAISGATDKSYTATPLTADVTYYYCIVTNQDSAMSGSAAASTASNIVSVTVKALSPTIKQQPVPSTVYQGGSLSLSVKATGSGKLTYQWYSNTENSNSTGIVISGATSAAYKVPTTSEETLYYYCIVTNTIGDSTGTAVSDVAAVTVKAAPTITKQPESVTINSGESFTLSVEATGGGTLSYQWYSNTKDKNLGGKKIQGATSSTYKCTMAASSETTTTYYYCVVTCKGSGISKGKAVSVTSGTAAVTTSAVNAPAPKITSKLTSQTVTVGDSVVLTIEVTGSGTLSYQWYSNTKGSTKGAAAISGATGASLTVTPTKAGITYYYCVVTNTDNTVTGSHTASAVSQIVKITAKA